MAFPVQYKGGAALKGAIIFLTIVTLVLLDPSYVTAYISINYEIVIIYIVSALTLIYCLVSLIMYLLSYKSQDEDEEIRTTNSALAEVVFSSVGVIGWMLVCGIGGTVAQRTIIETGHRFGWMGACAGINAVLFVAIMGLFMSGLLKDKVFSPERRYKYTNRM
ncbi:unnamed protein product [Bursaphelenchus xylophilus]|uniref:(pine wood nematode) hypothetical protein n=1 Tax=Bursaphelenchus xylophilus TaxID=6326 RepID=A0A1I7STE4_BURXY|nr:unnamed protein product [Bursaphelenchus xylophilus]CAG9108508.1 unnamed protein product [Bursaphelenchus xylophilus]